MASFMQKIKKLTSSNIITLNLQDEFVKRRQKAKKLEKKSNQCLNKLKRENRKNYLVKALSNCRQDRHGFGQ